jgi:flagellar basal body rod protein FlgG
MSGDITGILSGARTQEIRLEVLSNNMANINTVGFKEDRVFRIPPMPSSVSENIAGASSQDDSQSNNSSRLPILNQVN